MMKIAIVGATGPTGIHLVTELRKSVATVRVIARSIDKLARLFPEAAVEKLSADILYADATLRAVDGCDIVYDCIGLPGDQMHLHPAIARNIAGALRYTKPRCVQVSRCSEPCAEYPCGPDTLAKPWYRDPYPPMQI
jgi:putative NADH-flavin reductase